MIRLFLALALVAPVYADGLVIEPVAGGAADVVFFATNFEGVDAGDVDSATACSGTSPFNVADTLTSVGGTGNDCEETTQGVTEGVHSYQSNANAELISFDSAFTAQTSGSIYCDFSWITDTVVSNSSKLRPTTGGANIGSLALFDVTASGGGRFSVTPEVGSVTFSNGSTVSASTQYYVRATYDIANDDVTALIDLTRGAIGTGGHATAGPADGTGTSSTLDGFDVGNTGANSQVQAWDSLACCSSAPVVGSWCAE